MDFLLPFRKIMLIWNTVAEDLFLHLETNGRLEWIFLTGSEEMIVHTETKVMFCWCLIDSHDKTIAESTCFFLVVFRFWWENFRCTNCALPVMLHYGNYSSSLLEKKMMVPRGTYWREGSPKTQLFFKFVFVFIPKILPEILGLATKPQPAFLHPCVLCLVQNEVVYSWKWSMAPAGLSSAKTSLCRKPLKCVLCHKQRWKTEVVFPDSWWMDADVFVSSLYPLKSLDVQILPAVLLPMPAEGFIVCIPSEECLVPLHFGFQCCHPTMLL